MYPLLRRAWAEHRWLTLGFALALSMALLMAGRLTFDAVYWSTHRDRDIAPWMTVGYVARSHQVPRQALFAAVAPELGLTRGEPETIREMARRLEMDEDRIIALIEAELARLKAEAS